MGRAELSLLVAIACVVTGTVPLQARAGGRGFHEAFAIKPVGDAGDEKTRLWSGISACALAPDLSIKCGPSLSCYPWKLAIVSTVFWVGETGSGPGNAHSAWDKNWVSSYGGVDDPVRRNGFEPAAFRPRENPFYVALPYCDMLDGRLKPEATRLVPWSAVAFRGATHTLCKDRWIEIRHGVKTCYAQWEDVGPFHTNLAGYVFGDERPPANINHGAGIDVSPAIRDYLGLGSLDLVDWRFMEPTEVPGGPWSLYDRW